SPASASNCEVKGMTACVGSMSLELGDQVWSVTPSQTPPNSPHTAAWLPLEGQTGSPYLLTNEQPPIRSELHGRWEEEVCHHQRGREPARDNQGVIVSNGLHYLCGDESSIAGLIKVKEKVAIYFL